MLSLHLISPRDQRILEIFAGFYFLSLFFYFKNFHFSFVFFIFPIILLFLALLFLKKQEDKNLLFQLYSLLIPLESQMKMGMSFINAWQKSLKEVKSEKVRNRLKKVSEIFKFQNEFHYPDQDIENFIKDLMLVHQSSNPLKRLKHLQRKAKIEMTFHTKAQRLLLQTRVQSGILSFFYLGLLIWTFSAYGSRYIHLILLSFLLFFIGLFWIFKIGRRMPWSV